MCICDFKFETLIFTQKDWEYRSVWSDAIQDKLVCINK